MILFVLKTLNFLHLLIPIIVSISVTSISVIVPIIVVVPSVIIIVIIAVVIIAVVASSIVIVSILVLLVVITSVTWILLLCNWRLELLKRLVKHIAAASHHSHWVKEIHHLKHLLNLILTIHGGAFLLLLLLLHLNTRFSWLMVWLICPQCLTTAAILVTFQLSHLLFQRFDYTSGRHLNSLNFNHGPLKCFHFPNFDFSLFQVCEFAILRNDPLDLCWSLMRAKINTLTPNQLPGSVPVWIMLIWIISPSVPSFILELGILFRVLTYWRRLLSSRLFIIIKALNEVLSVFWRKGALNRCFPTFFKLFVPNIFVLFTE